jgi:thymidylate synthase ThyX
MTASLPFSVGDYPQPQLESQVKLLYSNRCSTQVLVPELPDITIYIESLQSRIVGQPLERIRIASP